MAESGLAPVGARIIHQVERRTRLRLAGEPPHERLVALADALAAAGFDKVEVRPKTGSVILTHTTPWASLSGAAEAAGLKLLPKAPEPPPKNAITEAGERITQADFLLQMSTKGRLDLRNAVFLGLMTAGFVQLARGQVAGPALTVFSHAATLVFMDAWRRRP